MEEPKSYNLEFAHAAALERNGQYEEALKRYNNALLTDPLNPEILLRRKVVQAILDGITLEKGGQYEDALKCYDNALLIDPHNRAILFRKNAVQEILDEAKAELPKLPVAVPVAEAEKKLVEEKKDEDEMSELDSFLSAFDFLSIHGMARRTSDLYDKASQGISTLTSRLSRLIINDPIRVRMTIKDGKIYWKLFDRNTGEEKYTRHKGFTGYTEENSWTMTWKQFREFKDSGKLIGTSVITKDFFLKHAAKLKNPEQIWDQLLAQGILIEKNKNGVKGYKPTMAWLFLSKKTKFGTEEKPGSVRKIIAAILLEKNKEETSKISDTDFPPGYLVHRPHRLEDESELKLSAALWDVGPYKIFNSGRYAASNIPVKVQRDHIPSNRMLELYRDSLISPIEAKNLKILRDDRKLVKGKLGADAQRKLDSAIDAISDVDHQCMHRENEDIWWTVVMPADLHVSGETYGGVDDDDLKTMSLCSNAKRHLDNLDTPEDFSLTHDDRPKALGAFRHLFRQQARNGIPLTPFEFFKKQSEDPEKGSFAFDKMVTQKAQKIFER